jgi:hypothetical protein
MLPSLGCLVIYVHYTVGLIVHHGGRFRSTITSADANSSVTSIINLLATFTPEPADALTSHKADDWATLWCALTLGVCDCDWVGSKTLSGDVGV